MLPYRNLFAVGLASKEIGVRETAAPLSGAEIMLNRHHAE
jgi:hypothetical protein